MPKNYFNGIKNRIIVSQSNGVVLFSFLCSILLFLYLQTFGYFILHDASDYIGLSRNPFRNQFHVDQSLEFWWPPLYYLLISPIWSPLSNQDTWIHFIQSVTFGFFLHELYRHLLIHCKRVTLLQIVAMYLFIFSVPGLVKYFLTPHPEGLFLLLILIVFRLVENKQNVALILFCCATAYFTKYSAISLMAATSWYAFKNYKNRFVLPLGCIFILGIWSLITMSLNQAPQRGLNILWQQRSFDFTGPFQFVLPFFPVPEWSTNTAILIAIPLLLGLLIWYRNTKSIYLLFSIFTFLLHLASYILTDPTAYFDERLYLPFAIGVSLELITKSKTKILHFSILAFAILRIFPTVESIAETTQLYSKGVLLRVPYVNFLKNKENELGSLCLIFENKNHSSLFEKSKSFRMFRFPITAKPDPTINLQLAKKIGFKECFLVKRHYCPSSDILCDYPFENPKIKIFSDPEKLGNGADIYKIEI